MARFTNFNQILSQGSPNEDEDDDDDDNESGDKGEGNFDEDSKKSDNTNASSGQHSDAGIKIEKVTLKEPEKLEKDFIDNNYWNITQSNEEIDVDALLAELDE